MTSRNSTPKSTGFTPVEQLTVDYAGTAVMQVEHAVTSWGRQVPVSGDMLARIRAGEVEA